MNASPEGRIDIALICRHGRVAETRIRSTRRPLAQRLFAGKPPEQAAALASALFSVCGRAQGIAVEAACAAAEGHTATAEMGLARQRKILAEMAYEHVWRLLIDWPTRLGQAVDAKPVLALRRGVEDAGALAGALDEVLAGILLGETLEAWNSRIGADGLAGFDGWAAAGATVTAARFADLGQEGPVVSQVPLLPCAAALTADEAARLADSALASEAFASQPEWSGRAAETGAIARCADLAPVVDWIARRGRGAGARLLARLVELTRLPEQLGLEGDADVLRAWSLPDGVGVAAVETARGLLLHVAQLESGRIARYRIVAPTEWNFHPAGALAEALLGRPDGPGLAADARQAALALDPCVDYAITVETA